MDMQMKQALTTAHEGWLQQAADLFSQVAHLTHDGVGISRQSYGEKETLTLQVLRHWATERGLVSTTDFAGNGLFSMPGLGDEAAIICGSHIDSVPQGGNFDGLAGVVAGLLVLERLNKEGIHAPFKVVATRGEESAWFGKAYMGSSAVLGKLTTEDLALRNKHSGCILRDAMASVGADVDAIARGESADWVASAKAYLELHIEQGPLMVARGWPTAIVSGIRGNVRHNRIVCAGEAGHSGAVPRWLRRDAVFAVADLLMRLDEHWRVLLERGIDLVVTSGIVSTNPQEHAVSRIPGTVEFSFEARSQDSETLAHFYTLMRGECDEISKTRGVTFEFDRKIVSRPAAMSAELVRSLLEAAGASGLPQETMPSGAGHDAAMFANAGIPSGMIFVRNEHGSHNPLEAMDLGDFVAAAEILYRTVRAIK